ncbi:putative RNA-directed DNA polymerase from transposon BS [Trichonephila clavipes]|nr:putative RNA-directed DNA polymerase from transposon BS [Trichonephila clavipes]
MDGKGLISPKTAIDTIATHCRFLILSIPNNEMSRKSPFAIQKALQGIGGNPKSVKKLRSGDLLIETISALQTKSFLLAKTFIDSNLTVTPHKSLNSCRGVISEPDLLYASEGEILEGLSDQEARKLVVPQTSRTYAQAAKSSNKTSSAQTDENITKIKCPPLQLLQPLSSTTRTNLSISTPDVSTSSSSTQAPLLPSTYSISSSNSESQPPIPTCNDAPSNSMVTLIESSSSITYQLPHHSPLFHHPLILIQYRMPRN